MSARSVAIGTMRDRVQLQRKDMVSEVEGGHSTVFVPLATVWARVTALSGGEAERADARTARISHTVVVRFRTDLKAGDRIIYRGATLDVISASDLNGRRAYLSCKCTQTQVVG